MSLGKKLLVFLLLGIFLISLTSALTFDNRLRSYDESTETIIIDDNFGIGGDLVKVQLMENTYTCLTECHAILNITIYNDDDNFLSNLILIYFFKPDYHKRSSVKEILANLPE